MGVLGDLPQKSEQNYTRESSLTLTQAVPVLVSLSV